MPLKINHRCENRFPVGACCVDQGVLFLQLKRGEWAFNDFLREGLVEYLDVNEENNALIALYEHNCGAAAHPSPCLSTVLHMLEYVHAMQNGRSGG